MGHLAKSKEGVYYALAERLNKNPVGTPINETLMAILHRLYTVSEAEVGSKFPLFPMTLDDISNKTGIGKEELKKLLEQMAGKGLVIDIIRQDNTYYMLAPMVVGFFEYTFMRIREEIQMKELAELFSDYFDAEGVREELFAAPTKMFRALAYESIIPIITETEVLSYEKASEIIRQSGGGALSICQCRHKAGHLGTACDAPLEVCTSLGNAASYVVRRGMGKPATVDELLHVLDQTEKYGLVHLGDNVLNKPAFICHCCGCCCEVLQSINKSKIMSVSPSNFIPTVDEELCEGCGVCTERCQIKAIRIDAAVPIVDKNICIGCGICAANCPTGALTMSRQSVIKVPPKNRKEQLAAIAKEKGKIFY